MLISVEVLFPLCVLFICVSFSLLYGSSGIVSLFLIILQSVLLYTMRPIKYQLDVDNNNNK